MSSQVQQFQLTEAERQSALWLKLEDNFRQRLETLRKQNDCEQGEQQTAVLRGRIAEVKAVLALGNAPLIED